jgi:hypothetical protein
MGSRRVSSFRNPLPGAIGERRDDEGYHDR